VVYNETAQCLKQILPDLMVLPESLCGQTASRDDVNCWNGHSNDRYRKGDGFLQFTGTIHTVNLETRTLVSNLEA